MSGNDNIHVKNYQFMYPSVAVWEDFDQLKVTKGKKEKSKSFKKYQDRSTAYYNFNELGDHDERKMKRKDQPKKTLGAFIHPSQFTLDHSVLLPSSRAAVRLEPIKNAPVPKIGEKADSNLMPSFKEKSKIFKPGKRRIIDEKEPFDLKPVQLWSPPEQREYTEIVKEPTLFLDVNYASDGDLDVIDVDQVIQNNKEEKPKISPPKKFHQEEKQSGIFPDIKQSVKDFDSDQAQPNVSDFKNKNSEEISEHLNEELFEERNAEILPKISKSPDKEAINSKHNIHAVDIARNQEIPKKSEKNNKDMALPVLKALKGSVKTTARYSVKSRHQVAGNNANKTREKAKETKGILVGKERTKTTNRPMLIQKKQALFLKRKHVNDAQKAKQPKPGTPPTRSLPSISDQAMVEESVKSDDTGEKNDVSLNEPEEAAVMPEYEETSNAGSNETPAELSLPSIDNATKSTGFHDIDMEIDSPRVKTPRVLEFPLHQMKKNQKELYEEKRLAFRRLDIDGDGHLSLFELMKCFPENLTKSQVDYLKMIYQKACSSTFFGVEEFLCVEEMCRTMHAMSDGLREIFTRVDLRGVQARLDEFLLKFSEAYESKKVGAVFDRFVERCFLLPEYSKLKELLMLLSSNDRDIFHSLGKADFLLLIPFLVEQDILPQDLLI